MAILNLATYKTYQNINSTTNDAKISQIILGVNAFIVSYCNRTFVDFYSSTKVEYFDATLPDYYPVEFPLVGVASIKYSSLEDGTYDKTLVEHTDYKIDTVNSKVVAIGTDYFTTATAELNSGEITYTGGLVAMPEDIIQAAILLTEYYMEEAYTPRKSLAGASVDSLIQPDFTAKLPPHIRRILEHHRGFVV